MRPTWIYNLANWMPFSCKQSRGGAGSKQHWTATCCI